MALSIQSEHPGPMAKTWVPKNDTKSAKAFAKAIRQLQSKGNRRQQHSRPR